MRPAPQVDHRTARDIARQVRELLPRYVAGWQPEESGGVAGALVGIFARYCEIIIEKLNKAPEKNLLAFLNLLGASAAPAQPARAPLTFYLAAPTAGEVVVPALTQVAALPGPGEKEPVVFETERDLVIAPACLAGLWVRDDAHDRYAEYTDLLDQTALPVAPPKIPDDQFLKQTALRLTGAPPAPDLVAAFAADSTTDKRQRAIDRLVLGGVPMFRGNRPFDHFLFIAIDPVSAAPVWKELRLKFVLECDLPEVAGAPPNPLEWVIEDGAAGITRTPDSDSTQNLTRSGEVVFTNIAAIPVTALAGRGGRWLRVEYRSPEAKMPDALPVIREITVQVQTEQRAQRLEKAFLNNIPLDVSKDFFPLGEKPKFGDTLYLSSPLFATPGALVTLQVNLTNPIGSKAPIPVVRPNAPRLQWEFWNDSEWAVIGISEYTAPPPPPPVQTPAAGAVRFVKFDPPKPAKAETAADSFDQTHFDQTHFDQTHFDQTQALVQNGLVSLRLPDPRVQYTIAGQPGYWIRVQLISGDYGREAGYELEGKSYVITPATFAAPVVHVMEVRQELRSDGAPAAVFTYNDFAFQEKFLGGQPFAPFVMGTEANPCCYLGLQPLVGQFPGHSMSFYFGLANPRQLDVEVPDSDRPTAIWEYWNGKAWTQRTIQDDTGGLRHSGLIRFLAPFDFSTKAEFGSKLFWLRARKVQGATLEPRLRRILLNTTMAAHTQSTTGEVLGSGTGKPGQILRTSRKPLLDGQILEVLEPAPPSSEERGQIERDEGPDAIRETAPTPTGAIQAWVRWHEMPDFESSAPRDRHYVLNRDTGEVKFGDGVAGLVPPVLTSNVRMAIYRTGGGSAGNKPAASIMQLKTTVPYVGRVTNFEAADGGSDVETVESVLERAPREIRHGGRAVTGEDFEDLAKRASSEVARAKCLPLVDLDKDKEGRRRCPGAISLIVVPRWADGAVEPQAPSAELFTRVRQYLDARRFRSVKLVLAGADYIRIGIKAEITVKDVGSASRVELAVTLALGRFLHPLTGRDGAGWAFGRLPQRSDVYPVMENVPGVEHVRTLEIAIPEDTADIQRMGRFLIYAGDIQVAASLEEHAQVIPAASRLNGRVPPVSCAASGGPRAFLELAHNGLAPRGGWGRVSELFGAALRGLCALET
jgi:hypothetical protein